VEVSRINTCVSLAGEAAVFLGALSRCRLVELRLSAFLDRFQAALVALQEAGIPAPLGTLWLRWQQAPRV
jgi:hypothetical protein